MADGCHFERIGRPPSWIFKIKFLSTGALEKFCIIVPNFVQIGYIVAEILQFLVFFLWNVKIH